VLPETLLVTLNGTTYFYSLPYYVSPNADGSYAEYKLKIGDTDYLAIGATYAGYNSLTIMYTSGLIGKAIDVFVEGIATVHQLDEKFIPDSIARVSDLARFATTADWSQNDTSAADYVKNRTHYRSPSGGFTTIYSGTTPTASGAEVSLTSYTDTTGLL
jgi:hypothetical protein